MGTRRIVVGMSGATGAILGIRLLEVLRTCPDIESHLIVTGPAKETIALETEYSLAEVQGLADVSYRVNDIAATLSSGSFRTQAMVVIPCSMHSLGQIAHGLGGNLLVRAAEVTLKERRRLVLVARETPLHLSHIRNMLLATEAGATVMPPVPAFYHRPQTIAELVDHTVTRVLDQLDVQLEHELVDRWAGGVGRAGSAVPDRRE